MSDLRRPIIGIENRTAQEVFDIMCARFQPDPRLGKPVHKTGGDYQFDGEVVGVITKRSGEVRFAVEDDRGLLLIMNAKQIGIAP